MEQQAIKPSSLDLPVTDAGYLTNAQSSVAHSKRRNQVNDYAIARLYRDRKLKVKDVCKILNIRPQLLYTRLQQLGIQTRTTAGPKGRRLEASKVNQIQELHRSGLTNYKIAKQVGVTHPTVARYVKLAPVEVPQPEPVASAPEVITKPSIWSRIKSWFN